MTSDRYQRRTEYLRAFRLTDTGMIPIEQAHAPWVTRAIAERKMHQGPKGGWFVGTGVYLRAVYPGDWIIWYESTENVYAVSSTVFDMLFEAVPAREEA